MPRFLTVFACILMAAALAACGSDYTKDGYSTSTKNITNYNYAAVDALMSRAGRTINKGTPMLVGTVGNVNNVESSSTLGRAITEQISARLAQRGYKVAEMKLRQGITIQQGGLDSTYAGEFLLSRDAREVSGEHKAAAAITGTYAVGASNVLVNLRLVDIRTGNVITGYDYTLPKTKDVAVMSGGIDAGATASFFTTGDSF